MRPNHWQAASRTDADTGVRRVILFDFDGVLVRGDAFAKWLRQRFAQAWWLAIPVLLLAPALLLASVTSRGRRMSVRLVVTLALVGLDEATYRRRAHAFGRTLARDTRDLSRAAFAALNAHRQAGDRVLVVTGCEETLARAILDELGLASVELVASHVVPDRLGLRVAVRNVGREKLRQLALHGIHPEWDLAYSDSLVDLPMLAGARASVLVNPRGDTFARATQRLGSRVTAVDWR
jgi:phosphatidylglycerophosphatase C